MSSKKEILNNEEFVKVIEEAARKRELFSHYDFYLYDPENYKTILTEEPKDRKIEERKYRGFHFNDDQMQTKEDGGKYIEIIEYEEVDLFGDCLEEIKNNIILMNLRKKTEIVRGRSWTFIMMKKKIKIIH